MKNIFSALDKQSVIRTWFQAAFFVVTNGYIRGFSKGKIFAGNTKVACFPGLNCYSCPGALAACPMGALQAVLGDAGYRISLYIFGMLAALGVVFGRLICGWMCPFGLVQDLLYKIPFTKKIKNLPGHKYLKYLRYVVLIIFPIILVSLVTDKTGTGSPWFCEWICPSGMLFGGIPLVAANVGLREAIGVRFAWKLLLLIIIVLLSIKSYRPFCKYLCPLGAIYGFFNPISSYRLEIDSDKCISCGKCQKACGMDIKTYENPNSMDCIRCGSCITVCPEGAISSTWSQTKEKVKARCFVDDSEVAGSSIDVSPTIQKRVAVFGIMTALIGIIPLVFMTPIIFEKYMTRIMTIDAYAGLNPSFIAYEVILVIASIFMTATGIYLVANRSNSEAVASATEKMAIISLTILVDIIIGVVLCKSDRRALQFVIEPLLFIAGIILGGPLGIVLSKKLKKMQEFGVKKISWTMLTALYAIVVIFEPIFLFVLYV